MTVIRHTVFFALLCFLVTLIQAKDVKYCDKKADYDVKISGVEITPYPVTRGKSTTFSIAASTAFAFSIGWLAASKAIAAS